MAAEENKELIVRLLAAMNTGDTEMIQKNLTEDFVRHDMVEVFSPFMGKDGASEFVEALQVGLPDLRIAIEDIFATEDRVAVRETNRGTHTGPLLGIQPTGREVEFSGINIYRMENGLVAETWQHIDWHGALRQLGIEVTLEPAHKLRDTSRQIDWSAPWGRRRFVPAFFAPPSKGEGVQFIVFEGQTVKDGMMGQAYEWLTENEDDLRSAAPEGSEYLGFYAPIFVSDKNPGDLFLVYAVDSYGALDRQAASGDSRWGELLNEWHNTFIDGSPGTLGRKILYKSLTAATVWGG